MWYTKEQNMKKEIFLHMASISVNFKSRQGKIKPMHAVNNGPIRPSNVFRTIRIFMLRQQKKTRNTL